MRGQNGTPDPCLISFDTFSKLQRSDGTIQPAELAGALTTSIDFSKMGGAAWGAGGHVQVSSYGALNTFCHVGSWSTGGPDFSATVLCFGHGSGGGGGPALQDSQFDLLFLW